MAEEQPAPGMRGGFAPVADGTLLPKGKFFSDPAGLSADVPMLICTTFHEWGMARTNPEMEALTAEKAIEMMKGAAVSGVDSATKLRKSMRLTPKCFRRSNPSR